MDKEAQEKIENIILFKRKESEPRLILEALGGLGYRKLPKDKPPLLSKQALIDLFPGGETIHWAASFKIAQAQREVCIKHYEGGN